MLFCGSVVLLHSNDGVASIWISIISGSCCLRNGQGAYASPSTKTFILFEPEWLWCPLSLMVRPCMLAMLWLRNLRLSRFGRALFRGIFVQNLQSCNFLLDDNDHAVLGDLGFHPCCLDFRCQIQILSKDLGLQITCPRTLATRHQRPN
ncbi:hypothetical protein VPH35_047570 [Triticum aestivum]|uniref:Uncharacterized protein n=1 Tax=Triticum urartu TaxID=4572 RepID=A0A8R7RBP9_TRIUA